MPDQRSPLVRAARSHLGAHLRPGGDISEVGGVSITGHQQPVGSPSAPSGDVLLLPPEMMPKQVISLLGLGGPSFPLADHYNHIHIGY